MVYRHQPLKHIVGKYVYKMRQRQYATARKMKYINRTLSRMGETKYVQSVSTQSFPLIANGDVLLQNPIAAGDGEGARDGMRVENLYYKLQGTITSTLAYASGVACELYLVWDKQPNEVAPDIAGNENSLFRHAPNGRSIPNGLMKYRYKILKSQHWVFENATTANTSGKCTTKVEWYVPLKKLRTYYTGTGSTITDINHGSLYLVGASNVTAAGFVLSFNSKLAYKDV